MSGWIKKEKDLRDDPRVRRMAMRLAERFAVRVTVERDGRHGEPLQGDSVWVTVVLGALDQIWMHGDSFVRDDDTLEATAAELDKLVGLPGFCSLMPPDWLTQDLGGTIKLVDFGLKNSPAAKAAAMAADRAATYRARKRARDGVTVERDGGVTRQTRHTDIPEEDARARAAPVRLPSSFDLTPQRRQFALDQQIDPVRTFKKFCMHGQHAEGPTATKRDWDDAWRRWCLRERPDPEGEKPKPSAEEIAAGAADFERRKAAARAAAPIAAGPPPPPGVARR